MKYCTIRFVLAHLGQWITMFQTLGIAAYTEQPRREQIMGFMNLPGFVGLVRPLRLHFTLYLMVHVFFNGRIKGSHKISQTEQTSLSVHL